MKHIKPFKIFENSLFKESEYFEDITEEQWQEAVGIYEIQPDEYDLDLDDDIDDWTPEFWQIDELNDSIREKTLQFDSSEKKRLDDILKGKVEHYEFHIPGEGSDYLFSVEHPEQAPFLSLLIKNNGLTYQVTKLKDEWIYVRVWFDDNDSELYFHKCDQLEGFIEYLKSGVLD